MDYQLLLGDCLKVLRTLATNSVHTVVTSPPYWGLRDYGVDGQLGLEQTPEEYVANMVAVFRQVWRALRDDGTVWLNLGDSYAGSGRGLMGDGTPSDRGATKQGTNRGTTIGVFPGADWGSLKPKDLVGIPWRVAFALQADGWYLRSDIIWHKPNPMPESVTDRPTKAHEYIFLLTKSARYYYDAEAIKEGYSAKTEWTYPQPDKAAKAGVTSNGTGASTLRTKGESGRNRRSVWTVATQPYSGAHFATFPPKLIEPCILAGCPVGGTVLDPFNGAGTTGVVAGTHGRNYIGIELNPEYLAMADARIGEVYRTARGEFRHVTDTGNHDDLPLFAEAHP